MTLPTIGQIVTYHSARGDMILPPKDSPYAAIIAGVVNEKTVNLMILDHNGFTNPKTGVAFIQPGDKPPINGNYCIVEATIKEPPKTETAPVAPVKPVAALPEKKNLQQE